MVMETRGLSLRFFRLGKILIEMQRWQRSHAGPHKDATGCNATVQRYAILYDLHSGASSELVLAKTNVVLK